MVQGVRTCSECEKCSWTGSQHSAWLPGQEIFEVLNGVRLILVNEIMALAGGASIGLLTAPLGRPIFEGENYSISQSVGTLACGQRRGLQ